MSKLLKRKPWEEGPGRTTTEEGRAPTAPRTPMSIRDLPEDTRNLLIIRPRRNPEITWEVDEGTGLVTLIYEKKFSRVERAMATVLKPVEELRRPLDAPGSDIWQLCDGEHTIASICTVIDQVYGEQMEPVLRRVVGFIEGLAQRGLVILAREDNEAGQEDRETE